MTTPPSNSAHALEKHDDLPATFNLALLHLLLQHPKGVSANILTEQVQLDKTELEVCLNQLEHLGCEVRREDNPTSNGLLTLEKAGLGTWVDYLECYCKRQDSNHTGLIKLYQSTESTQDIVRQWATDAAGSKTVNGAAAIANDQHAGRGRLGRRWYAPAGTSALLSMALTTDCSTTPSAPVPTKDTNPPLITANRLAITCAIAVARAIEIASSPNSVSAQIKWPNDVMVNGKKIAGILIEALPNHQVAIVGVGVNVNLTPQHLPDDAAEPGLQERVTSLSMCNREVDRLIMLRELINALRSAANWGDDDAIKQEWLRRSLIQDGTSTFRHNGSELIGRVEGMDLDEGLIVRTQAGQLIHLPAATTSINR